MNRRGFFATIAAVVAAPKAWLTAKPKVDDSKSFTGSTGVLNTFELNYGRFPHECAWVDLPKRAAERCVVCGDTRSRQHWLFDEVPDEPGALPGSKRYVGPPRQVKWNWHERR